MKSSTVLFSLGIISFLLSSSPLLWAGEAGKLTLDVDGGKQVDFISFNWGDGSTGVPGAAAVSGGEIHSITFKRKSDGTSAYLASAQNDKRSIPSASLQIPASGSGAATTVTLHNLTVVNVQAGGATTDKAAASELVKLGFESMVLATSD